MTWTPSGGGLGDLRPTNFPTPIDPSTVKHLLTAEQAKALQVYLAQLVHVEQARAAEAAYRYRELNGADGHEVAAARQADQDDALDAAQAGAGTAPPSQLGAAMAMHDRQLRYLQAVDHLARTALAELHDAVVPDKHRMVLVAYQAVADHKHTDPAKTRALAAAVAWAMHLEAGPEEPHDPVLAALDQLPDPDAARIATDSALDQLGAAVAEWVQAQEPEPADPRQVTAAPTGRG
jgi:hypothetical protein